MIIRENRTYDQMLGDVVGGNGDPSLADFGDNSTYAPTRSFAQRARAGAALPAFDNFYDPSRQSADGHNWIVQAMAPYSDDIQSPDWLRDYPSNGGDAIAYQQKGHLWDTAEKAGVSVKNYGEYIEYNTFTPPGCTLNNKYTSYSSAAVLAPVAASFQRYPVAIHNRSAASRCGLTSTTTYWRTSPARRIQLYNYNTCRLVHSAADVSTRTRFKSTRSSI